MYVKITKTSELDALLDYINNVIDLSDLKMYPIFFDDEPFVAYFEMGDNGEYSISSKIPELYISIQEYILIESMKV